MKKKSDMRPLIIAALEKLGPSSPRQILDKVGCDEQRLKYYLRTMIGTGQVKAVGKTLGRVYALPSQKFQPRAAQLGGAADAQRRRDIEILCEGSGIDKVTRDHWITSGASINAVAEQMLGILEEQHREHSRPASLPIAARTADGRIVLLHGGGPCVPTVIDALFAPALTELLKAA